MMIKQVILLAIGITLSVLLLGVIAIQTDFTYDDDYCSVCDWNYHHGQLLIYKDPGHGHTGALQEIWDSANYGEEVDLDWYENYRLKYNLTDVDSFYFIDYNNSCPREPDLKYLGTGYIMNYIPWSYDGPAYSITTVQWNGSNYTFNNCRWNPYPYNHSNPTHVFRRKHGAWWNQFKEASLFDAFIYTDKPEIINQSWNKYYIDYQNYLDNGGVNVGSEY